jgi:XTP/dITP diphosphohydrolase
MEELNAVLASSNEDKLRELRRALPGWRIELLRADAYPPEVGATYLENARAKAEFARMLEPELWALGEDSGVEIEGLGWGPGVTSARWAGGDPVGQALAVLAADETASRRARYVCELVAISPQGEEFRGTGTLEGRIAEEPRGDEGFGFDPVFVPEGEERTVAELGNEWKAQHSHRARAAQALLQAVASKT